MTRTGRHGLHIRAFVDESFRENVGGFGVYLFAAVSVAANREDEIRDRLRRALPGRLSRFHWSRDRDEVRERALAVLRTADLAGLTVYRLDVPRAWSEKARQHALWNLVQRMRERDVHDLIFEARERTQNNKDDRTLHAVSRSQVSSPEFRYAFMRPLDEPLLWLPDSLAGAYGEALRDGGSDRYLTSLPDPLLKQYELPPLK